MKLIKNKDGWKQVRLDDVVIRREENDRENAHARFDTFVKVEHMEAGSLHLRELGSQKDEELPPTFYKIFREGQILFPTRNPHLRRTALAPCDGICGEKTLTLEVNAELADPRFIPFLFHSASFYDHSASAIIGSTNPHCRWRDIANFEFLLPPRDQQAKLAGLLWAADREVQTLVAAEDATIRFRDSTFKAFRGKLNKKLSKKVADLLVDGPKNGFSPKTSEEGTSYTVSIGAVKDGRFTPEGNIKKATVDQLTLDKFNVRKNDLFVVRGNGNRLLCGRAGLAMETQENLFYPDLLIRLRFDDEQIVPEFAAYQWNHPSAHYRLLQRAKSTNGISKINGADIKSHTLIVPPILEQEEILNEIGEIEKRVTALGETKTNSIRLEKSLINQIF